MIKDYTNKLTDNFPSEGKIPVVFTLHKPGNQKLAIVKAFKFYSGLGLRDSKDIIDESVYHPIMFRKYMTIDEVNGFKESLSECDAEYTLDAMEKMRNRKLIDLGICEDSELVSEILDIIINRLLIGGFSVEKLKSILIESYSNFDREKLMLMYNSLREKELQIDEIKD